MNISEQALRELVFRILRELQTENREKMYMVCASSWDKRYVDFLQQMADSDSYDIYPVIPLSWQRQGYETILKTQKACCEIVYWGKDTPTDLETAVTVFPVVERTLLAKAALCISDSFESCWIADGIGAGGRIALLYSGLQKFTGKEKPAYVERIMTYYRQILEYGIEICGLSDLLNRLADEPIKTNENNIPHGTFMADSRKKRVITASNVERLASDSVLYLRADDIITDIARDRAKFLNIVLK